MPNSKKFLGGRNHDTGNDAGKNGTEGIGGCLFQFGRCEGREALVAAFAATINPCKAVYHLGGQQNVTINDDCTEAEGTAYCEASLVTEENGKDIITTNYVRYSDIYVKVDGKWYIKRRRTTFLISDKRELGK